MSEKLQARLGVHGRVSGEVIINVEISCQMVIRSWLRRDYENYIVLIISLKHVNALLERWTPNNGTGINAILTNNRDLGTFTARRARFLAITSYENARCVRRILIRKSLRYFETSFVRE